jgi:hypothetical protein
MKSLLALAAAGLLAAPAFGQSLELQRRDPTLERQSYQLCSSWSYNFEINGYVCSFTQYVDMLDQWDLMDLDNTIRSLQQQVQDLQFRVQQLESRP